MNPILVLGYHGCSRTTAEKVLSGQIAHLAPSRKRYDWLGHGVYFWENSYDRALKWAKETIKEGEEPAVVGAIILPGQCLDLTDSQCTAALAEFSLIFEEHYLAKYGKRVPANDAERNYHPYDCALINEYREFWKEITPIDTVRGAFPEGGSIGGSSFSELHHIQWAVVHPEKCILGYFRPTELAK